MGRSDAGPHAIGFGLVAEYDHSRRVAPTVDFEGRLHQGPVAMPFPIAIWYPAARTSRTSQASQTASSRPTQYGTFAALDAKGTDLTPVAPADRAAAMARMRSFAGLAFHREITESAMAVVDTTTTASILDATPASGRFPVILAATDGSVAVATV